MTRPSVSVIVPVYNVSAYIEKCARSLFEQTLDDMEILFMDDCSPDNSVEIIKKVLSEYKNRNSLTRIIRMPTNAGQAGVRRQGIIEATGRYLIHLDGDDWVDPDYYKSLYDSAISTDADIVVGDEVMEYPGKTMPKSRSSLPSSGREIMKNWYRDTVGMFCHNKLVKRSVYIDNNILPWEGLNMWEDNGLFARLFYHADKVVQTHGPVYHYNRCNIGAMTAGYGEKQVNQMIGIAQNLTVFFQSKPDYKDFEKTVSAFQYLAKLNLITDSFKNYKRYRQIFVGSDSIASELDPGAFSSKGRLRFNMVRHGMAPMFIFLFKLKNKLHL
ncbi:MAG: glycosyltransferase [Muribaculum sp.]|nr:glycosyltransferase [Muribaculum sp.]